MGNANGLKNAGLTNYECGSLADLMETGPRKEVVGFCSSFRCAGHIGRKAFPTIWPGDKAVKGEKCPKCHSNGAIFWKYLTPGQIVDLRNRIYPKREIETEKII